MVKTDLIRLELNKLNKMPPWGRPQGDRWDRLSNFVYHTITLREVWQQVNAVAIAEKLDIEAFGAYAVRRWYNHHTHDQILNIFYNHADVRPEENRKHRTIDFYFRDLPFDLKISRFPKAYPKELKFAEQNPHHLALWQYKHQSKQGRYHTGNRLFIILHDQAEPELSWRLRRDFAALEKRINSFLQRPTLLGLSLTHQHNQEIYHPWSAIIFFIK
jgi:hypothetical protein